MKPMNGLQGLLGLCISAISLFILLSQKGSKTKVELFRYGPNILHHRYNEDWKGWKVVLIIQPGRKLVLNLHNPSKVILRKSDTITYLNTLICTFYTLFMGT